MGFRAQALDFSFLYDTLQGFKIRFQGYRYFEVKVDNKCTIGMYAHVNPTVTKFTVLIHGFGDDARSFFKLIKEYEASPSQSSFIAVDWPYHGSTDCDRVKSFDEVAQAVHAALIKFNRPIDKIVSQSLGTVVGAYLAPYYPDTPQVWLTPPFLKADALKAMWQDIMSIDTPVKTQVFINKILTKDENFPDRILRYAMAKIQRSQQFLKQVNADQMKTRLANTKIKNLEVIVGNQDELLPPAMLDLELLKKLSGKHPLVFLNCGHDMLRSCRKEFKNKLEEFRE